MDSATLMPQTRSPRMPTSTDPAGGMGTVRASTDDVFRAPSPPTQGSFSSTSPIPSVEVPPPSGTAMQELAPQDQDTASPAMLLEEPDSMPWSAQHSFPIGHGHACQTDADYPVSAPFAHNPGAFYHYTQNGMSYNHNNYLTYDSHYPPSSCPRSYDDIDLTGLPHDVNMAYPPAVYQIEPVKHHDLSAMSDPGLNEHLMQLREEYEHHYGTHMKQESLSGYQSPYSDMSRASTPNDEPPRYSHDSYGTEEGVIDKEQPYAQLIFQALLGAEGHTMILRDIYDWFKKYTDKASASETKGWQNSIRHNLSMNGAFEKVDQPNEDSRKGFMWRLTPEALIEGVKSTTRYRSKQPNKRGHRTHHPQPQRQASGAKGGHASRRSARSRHCARSVPAAYVPRNPTYYPSSTDTGFSYAPLEHGYAASRSVEMFPYAGDTAYVMQQSPGESLFTNSPSPSALDEPRTPGSAGGWGEDVDVGLPLEMYGSGCEEGVGMGMAYQEYAG